MSTFIQAVDISVDSNNITNEYTYIVNTFATSTNLETISIHRLPQISWNKDIVNSWLRKYDPVESLLLIHWGQVFVSLQGDGNQLKFFLLTWLTTLIYICLPQCMVMLKPGQNVNSNPNIEPRKYKCITYFIWLCKISKYQNSV